MGRKSKVIIAILTFVAMASLIQFIYLPQGQIIKEWRILKYDKDQVVLDLDKFKDVTLPYIENIDEPGIYEFSAVVTPDNINSDVLSLRRINGYAFEVSLNGQMIYQQGDMDIPTANIWNHSFLIDIPEGLLHQKNIFLIRVHGLHDIGFIMEPTIGTRDQYNLIIELQNLVSEGLSYMIIGASLILGILMMLLGFKQEKKNNYYVQFGLAFIMFSFYNFEFIYREYTGSVAFYFWFRKFLFLSIMSALGFLVTGVFNFLYELNINIKIKSAYYISLLPIILVSSFSSLRKIIVYYNIVLIIISLILIVAVMFNSKAKLRFSISYLMITIMHTVIVFIFGLPLLVFVNYGISVILIGLTYTLVLEFGKLQNEKIELEKKTTVDVLTNAYNREFMDKMKCKEGDLFIFIDIDYFKIYNDTLGHHQGDILLVELVKYIKSIIRDVDSVIRYGGDEFIIYLNATPKEQGKQKAILVKKYVQEHFEYVDISYGISEFVNNIHETLRLSDKYMYRMKEKKKR